MAPTARAATTLLRRLFLALFGIEALIVAFTLSREPVDGLVLFALMVGVATLAIAFLVVDRTLSAPLDRLARDLTIVARDHPALPLADPPWPWLKRLSAACVAVQARLNAAEGSVSAQVAAATAHADEQRRRLETLLLDLSEGVVVCDLQHHVLLYNQSAVDLFDEPHATGLGQSLLAALSREAIVHHLDRLLHRPPSTAPGTERFVCATAGAGLLRRARMALLTDHTGLPNGYVVTLADAGAEFDEAAHGDRMLRISFETQRGMLGSLQAAAETLAGEHDLSRQERERFVAVVLHEAIALAEQNATLSRTLDSRSLRPWIMSEVHTGDLIASLSRRVGAKVEIVQAGLPDWLLVESLSLIDLLEHLIAMLVLERDVHAVTVAIAREGLMVNVDLVWQGTAIRAGDLDDWLQMPFPGSKGSADWRGVLERHGTECWSRTERAGEALIRIPLPAAEAPEPATAHGPRPSRPEFYDFDLVPATAPQALKEQSLRSLVYVVFDVETTGLEVSKGDVPVAIGAVRVVNGRIRPLESFERLINPGRPIPPASIGFHGITDAMVAGKPPLTLVLSQFERFVGDTTILVAHNAAFDIVALCGGADANESLFQRTVLDTLLISASLDPEETDHSLDAIAGRLGLAVTSRHDALSDAMLTGAILVRQFERLEARGIQRLGQLLAMTDMRGRLRANQLTF